MLLFLTLGTTIYMLKKDRIKTYRIRNTGGCLIIGAGLGIFSSLLGIGGGTINLAILLFFFSMDIKSAAQNSLYIILFSQSASLLNTLVAGTVPEFHPEVLVLMVLSGIIGGMVGKSINRKIDVSKVSQLFRGASIIIMVICAYNVIYLW